MSLWKIVLKNIAQRKLSSTLTAASIALGVAVVVAVLALKSGSREAFRQSAFGCDLVIGPKGSALQLVLNTVFHMDVSPGNISPELYREIAAHKGVKSAVPVAVGDHYRGFRVVGTTDAFFRDFEVQGRVFKVGAFEAVVGASTGLGIGGSFSPSHGVVDSTETHDEKWTVTGILKPTGTPNDRAIFITLDSFHEIKGHRQTAEISAVIVKTREGGQMRLQHEFNQRPDCMAVAPAQVVADLFELIGKADVLLLAVAVLVILVAAVSILVSIYNSMADRRRAIAIMRALGARRSQVLSIVILEASALCLFGGLGGLVLGHLLTAVSGGIISSRAGVSISPLSFRVEELAVVAGVMVLGALAGLVPALKAYRTDIAGGLSPTS